MTTVSNSLTYRIQCELTYANMLGTQPRDPAAVRKRPDEYYYTGQMPETSGYEPRYLTPLCSAKPVIAAPVIVMTVCIAINRPRCLVLSESQEKENATIT